MSKSAGISEPESELERLIAELSQSGQLIFVFGIGWWTAHLTGAATPVFRGPADRRWWHVVLGDDAANWTMDVRVDEITGVRFVRSPYPFPSFAGRESLTVQFLGPAGRRCSTATCTTCMTGSRCARRNWTPGERYASASVIATSRESTEVPSWLLPPEPG